MRRHAHSHVRSAVFYNLLLLIVVSLIMLKSLAEAQQQQQEYLFHLRRERNEESNHPAREIQYYDDIEDGGEIELAQALDPTRHLNHNPSSSSTTPQRNLLTRILGTAMPDLQNTLLGSLISYFTPALRTTLKETLKKDFDPFVVSNSTTQDLGEVFTIGDCQTTAKIIYDSEILRGLASVQLDKIEMVEGSDDISYSIFDGATWNCKWVFNATFKELRAAANATLHIDACGTPAMEHKLNFSAHIQHPSIYMEIAVEGETSNLILFQSTSQVTKADVTDVDFHYHMVDAKLSGNFGNLSYVNLGVNMGETIYQDSGVFEKLMKEAIQSALDERLPFKPQDSF